MKDAIVAYMNTFSEYGSIIPDELAEAVNSAIVTVTDQIDRTRHSGISAVAMATSDLSKGGAQNAAGVMIEAAVSRVMLQTCPTISPMSNVVHVRNIGAFPFAEPSVGVIGSEHRAVTDCLNLVVVTCATGEFAHVCEIDTVNERNCVVIGNRTVKTEDKYDDDETRAGAELLKKDLKDGRAFVGIEVLKTLAKHPNFSELHPVTGDKAAIVIPEFVINRDSIDAYRGACYLPKTNTVKFDMELVPRNKVKEYLETYYRDREKRKISVKTASMLLNEMIRLILAIKPLIDTDDQSFSTTKFTIDMHEKIALLGVTREVTIRDIIRFLDAVVPSCYTKPTNPVMRHVVAAATISTELVSQKDLLSSVEVQEGTTRSDKTDIWSGFEVVARGIAQTAYKLVRKKLGVLPKITNIPAAKTNLEAPEDVSFCKIVDVVEKNDARLAICRSVETGVSTNSVALIVATAEDNRRIYDALDKDAILIKPTRIWSFGIIESEAALKKCSGVDWTDVIREAGAQGESLAAMITMYQRGPSMTGMVRTAPTDSTADIARYLIGSYVRQTLSAKTSIRLNSFEAGALQTAKNGALDLFTENREGGAGEIGHYPGDRHYTPGLPKGWVASNFTWQSCNLKELVSEHTDFKISAVTAQQLGVVTVRRATEQVAEDAMRSAATAFNRGMLRLISTGKEFKFALNPSSAEMIVRKDEIIFGGRKIKSGLVTPVPNIETSAVLFRSRCSDRYNNNSALSLETSKKIIKELSVLNSDDPAIKAEAFEKLNNDHILISFLLRILEELKNNKTIRICNTWEPKRFLFDHRYVYEQGNEDRREKILTLNAYFSENRRWAESVKMLGVFEAKHMRTQMYAASEEMSCKVTPIRFAPDSDVEDLFDFNNLVSSVVTRSLFPELFFGGAASDSERVDLGIRSSKLSDGTWLIDELTIGDVNVLVTVVAGKGKRDIETNRYFVNGHQIKAAELIRVVCMATCFEDTQTYNEAVAQISDVSLAARDILQNGFKADVTLSKGRNIRHSSIMLEIERVKNKWSLIVRDKDGNIKKTLHVPGGVSRFVAAAGSKRRKNKMDLETFSGLIGDIPGLEFVDIKRIHENGFTRYNQIIARSRKFLEDVIRMVGATYGTYKIGRGERTGYSVKGMSGKSYVVACSDIAKEKPFENDHGTDKFGAIYSVETGEYVCVVDRSSDQSGYDVIANRLLAMANDVALVDQIHTLGKFVR